MPTMIQSKKLASLRFAAPSRWLPHGWTGVGATAIGLVLIGDLVFCSSVRWYDTALPYAYGLLVGANALSGLRLSPRAPAPFRVPFRVCAVFQLSLSYYTVRFLPSFRLQQSAIVRVLDVVTVVPLVASGLGFFYLALVQEDPALRLAIAVGATGLALMLGYPLQLAGQADWLDCIVEHRYPAQDIAMAAYIYVPTTFVFGLILFGATLYLRKIVTTTQLGLWSTALIVGTLLTTVLLQEQQMPVVSAQDLFIVCNASSAPSVTTSDYEWLEQATSPRPLLKALLETTVVQSFFGLLGATRIEQFYGNDADATAMLSSSNCTA